MPRLSKISKSPPAAVTDALNRLGRNIRTARLGRRLSRDKLAEQIGISRFVLADIENGKPTTAMAAYVGALWALGFLKDLKAVAHPGVNETDTVISPADDSKAADKPKKELHAAAKASGGQHADGRLFRRNQSYPT
jgi:DNA-binding XRE family transcriptional regulator